MTKIQNAFTVKTLNILGTEGLHLNRIKGHILRSPLSTSTIIHNGENRKAFLLRSGTRQGCSFLPLLLNIVLEDLARVITSQNHTNQEERSGIFSVHRGHILHVQNAKGSTTKVLELVI